MAQQPTKRQVEYLRARRRQIGMSEDLLDVLCQERLGLPLAGLDRVTISSLIEIVERMEDIPATLRRLSGQIDLPGFEAGALEGGR